MVGFLASRVALSPEPHLEGGLPPAFLQRLRAYRGPLARRLPDVLALDPTERGTEALLAWAIDPPLLGPEVLGVDRGRWRRNFLWKLSQRSLTLEAKRQVVGLLTDPELQEAVLALVRE